ncbi:MAG: hypothetical protein E2O80_01035 [Betaproteobacteria bacterium]|nr:MAG: hypothetical protein E2O80_01035 [Betaproteobacteria bacterium]
MKRKIRVYCTIISYRIMNPEIEWMNNIVVMGAFLLVSGGVYAQENPRLQTFCSHRSRSVVTLKHIILLILVNLLMTGNHHSS